MSEQRLERYKIILVEPLYELNIGYTARVMKNFGFTNLCLVAPRFEFSGTCKIFAKHANDILEKMKVSRNLEEALQNTDLVVGTTGIVGGRRNILRKPLDPREFAKSIVQSSGSVAILFGREDIGLTNEELSLCDILVTIPTSPNYPILNISHAVAVILYEIYIQETTSGKDRFYFELPSRNEKEAFLSYVVKILDTIKYPENKREKVLLVFRRVLGKGVVTRGELHILMSFLRKIYIKMIK
ncbi:MAG: RNA methyltransferase [Thermoprotei archaeon]|nr:MAG: RNA methyltransferase [Thermoprotei archaeon]